MGEHRDDGNRSDKGKKGNKNENQGDEKPGGNLEILPVLILLPQDEEEKSQKEKKGDGSRPLHDRILHRVKDPGDQNRNQGWNDDSEK
uniref:Lfe109p2 n=1 Tax=Leptospirillum ferrooxidans TaxID=180 RepID=Q7X1M7_9BACT|nr:Lfe109p2 [Leptospirillum ferrooxidans]